MLREPQGRIVPGTRSTGRNSECDQDAKHQGGTLPNCTPAPARTKCTSVYAIAVAGEPSRLVFHHWTHPPTARIQLDRNHASTVLRFARSAIQHCELHQEASASTARAPHLYLRCISYHLKNS